MWTLQQHTSAGVSPLLPFFLTLCSFLLFSTYCLLSGRAAKPVELQLQRPMAPVPLYQWKVSQAGLPSPRPGPGPWPRALPSLRQRGAVCEWGGIQAAWHTSSAAWMQGRWDHHRYVWERREVTWTQNIKMSEASLLQHGAQSSFVSSGAFIYMRKWILFILYVCFGSRWSYSSSSSF